MTQSDKCHNKNNKNKIMLKNLYLNSGPHSSFLITNAVMDTNTGEQILALLFTSVTFPSQGNQEMKKICLFNVFIILKTCF